MCFDPSKLHDIKKWNYRIHRDGTENIFHNI